MADIEPIAELVLWSSLAVVGYIYAGYPLTLWLLPRSRSTRAIDGAGPWPSVTVVIAAHNEIRHITATVRNKLQQDYPADKLHVVVVSDGSEDGTDDAVRQIQDPRVELLRQEPRQGKTMALNVALAHSTSEIVVFSDANSIYEPRAVAHLVTALSDEQTGYVTGQLRYRDPGDTAVGGGSGLYMRYENLLRTLESRVGSVIGVNGGIDAVKRSLYEPMRSDHLPDFVLPLRVASQGLRVRYCASAIAFEDALGRQSDEFRMRVRVSLRALHTLAEYRSLLHPRHGLLAFQLLVHKLLRYLVVVPLAAALVASGVLATRGGDVALFGIQVVAYALALIGWLSGGRIEHKLVFVPFYFCLVNFAAAAAVVRFVRGERTVLWTPRKGA